MNRMGGHFAAGSIHICALAASGFAQEKHLKKTAFYLLSKKKSTFLNNKRPISNFASRMTGAKFELKLW